MMNPLLALLVLNVLLQVFDGVATARGLQLGMHEGNHLLAAAFDYWGVGPALVLSKGFACAALIFVYVAASREVARKALAMIAIIYGTCSLVPWAGALLAVMFYAG